MFLLVRNAALVLSLASCGAHQVNFGDRIVNADEEPGNWLTHGRNYQETRDSPLREIDSRNVHRLGVQWFHDLDTDRGQEATPIVVDGKMFTTSAWSKVQAFDAVSGKLLWQFDPEVPGEAAANACCDVVNRGVAYWDEKVFVGTLDGRLIALDIRSGKPVWSVMTVDPNSKNTITGAPRIVKGLVLIGNGGAEQGARGFISAYRVSDGALVWRFYTVPGAPGHKDGAASDEILEKLARKTWSGNWYTREGGLGGGTVWDSMAYDPALDLLYVGVGNASYWNRKVRSSNQGDNLFVSSILALRPGTGEHVWHYQQVPGDEFDYTATQHMVLADLRIDGKSRKTLLQAPKNGFFYVIDRQTGKLISAMPYATVNWADGIDVATGRPRIRPEARWSQTGKPFLLFPGPAGAHNWNPMAYSARTGYVYIPTQDIPSLLMRDDNFAPMAKGVNVGNKPTVQKGPPDPAAIEVARRAITGSLIAWDPIRQREIWRVKNTTLPNGGVLTTAGGLVFQGNADGQMRAFDEKSGQILWSYDIGTPIMAAPVTWSFGGRQYLTIVAGYGGSLPLIIGAVGLADNKLRRPSKSRVITFALDGSVKMPRVEQTPLPTTPPPLPFGDAAMANRGEYLYARTCFVCHGLNAVSASSLPDLRYSTAVDNAETWDAVVREGVLAGNGMISFASNFSKQDTDALRAYLVREARRARGQSSTSDQGRQ